MDWDALNEQNQPEQPKSAPKTGDGITYQEALEYFIANKQHPNLLEPFFVMGRKKQEDKKPKQNQSFFQKLFSCLTIEVQLTTAELLNEKN